MSTASGNVFTTSDDAVAAIMARHFSSVRLVYDPTGSYGVFYKQLSPAVRVVRSDLRSEVAPDFLASFDAIPLANSSADVVFFDPPYKRGSRNRASSDHYTQRYGHAPNTENAATKQYYRAIPELFRVARHGVVIKLQDAADGHSFHDRRLLVSKAVEEHTELRPHDVVVIYRRSPIKTLTGGRRRFFRQQVSYFLAWKWRLDRRKFMQYRH